MNDPKEIEAAYRRGYQQGAFAAIEAAERLTGGRLALRRLREWAEVSLVQWRYHEASMDGVAQPPRPPN